MISDPSEVDVERQLPTGNEIFFDHVGHFVRDAESAGRALARVGFLPTAPSIHVNSDADGGQRRTGTGNITAMLQRGYVEVLFKTAETPLGREFDTAIARYPGVHLAAFSVGAAAAAHRRLHASGFRVRPLVSMERPVATEQGRDIAAFTVARVEPEEMPEGRIQILTHHTEAAVWQPRWLVHPNGAVGLADLVIATTGVAETATRYSRFLDRPAKQNGSGFVIVLDRGRVQIVAPEALAHWVPGLIAPSLPFIGLYAVAVKSLAALERHVRSNGLEFTRRSAFGVVRFPDEVGIGAWMFVERSSNLPWRE